QLALMTRAGSGQPGRENLAPLGQETLERPLVLEVDDPHTGLTDGAGLGGALHSSSSSSLLAAATGTGWAPSLTTTRWRRTPSSSLMARSNSGSADAAVSNRAITSLRVSRFLIGNARVRLPQLPRGGGSMPSWRMSAWKRSRFSLMAVSSSALSKR